MYKDMYQEEITLNEVFNKFVHNYQLAYQGPNTARTQIGADYNTRMCTNVHSMIVLLCFFLSLPLCFFLHPFPPLMLLLLSLPLPAYSDFLVEYKVPGDEYLPLGPSFQEHVALFKSADGLRMETARLITQLELVYAQFGLGRNC